MKQIKGLKVPNFNFVFLSHFLHGLLYGDTSTFPWAGHVALSSDLALPLALEFQTFFFLTFYILEISRPLEWIR